MSAGNSLNMYSKSLSSSESPFINQEKSKEMQNYHFLQEASSIPSHSGFNLMAKRTPIQPVIQINHQQNPPQLMQNSILTTYPNNSSEGSSCSSSNIKPQSYCLSRQMSKQLPHHQQQISSGSTCEHSELRSFFSDNQHFMSNNHFSGKSAEEREQQQAQIDKQNSLQVSHFNYKPSDVSDSSRAEIYQTLQNDQNDFEEGESIGTCPQHPTKKLGKDTQSKKYQRHYYVRYALNKENNYGMKETEMDKFMGEVKNVKGLSDMLMDSFNAKLSQIRAHCLEQTQKVNGFFASIESELYQQKTVILSVLNDGMWEAINVIEQKKTEAKLLEKRFLRNEADILRNRNKIVSEMDETEGSEILKYYQQELVSTRVNLNEIFTGTQFQLAEMDANKLANDSAYIKKLVSQEILQPNFFTSSLQNPSLNISAQSREQQTPSMMIHGNQNKSIKTEEIVRSSRRNESQQKFESRGEQKQLQQQFYCQPDVVCKSIVETGGDSSMSEKQQTQESEDLGMQSIILQNDSKISNKSNISSNKIISYTDLHQQSQRDNHSNNGSTNHNSNNAHVLLNSTKQNTSNIKNMQYQSPPNSQKSEGQRMMSTHKLDNQGMAQQKYRQAAQTEPTHLPCNKFKQVLQGNNTGYQRNLMMNEEIITGNNSQNNNNNQYHLKYKAISQVNNNSKSFMPFQ